MSSATPVPGGITPDDANTSYTDGFQNVVKMLPVGVYTLWSGITVYVIGSGGYCVDEARRIVVWVAFAALTLASGVLAVLERHRAPDTGKTIPFSRSDAVLDPLRAISAAALFAGLAILTPPGSTCLLPGPAPGQSRVPDFAPQVFVAVICALSAALTAYGPQLRSFYTALHPARGGGGWKAHVLLTPLEGVEVGPARSTTTQNTNSEQRQRHMAGCE